MSAKTLRRRCRGAVLLEAALLMPLLLLMIFGMIELGHLVFTRHTLTGAARNGARVAIVPGTSNTDVENAVGQMMTASGFADGEYTVHIEDTAGVAMDVSSAARGDEVMVRVQCTWGTVGIRPLGVVPADRTLQGVVVMTKEGT